MKKILAIVMISFFAVSSGWAQIHRNHTRPPYQGQKKVSKSVRMPVPRSGVARGTGPKSHIIVR